MSITRFAFPTTIHFGAGASRLNGCRRVLDPGSLAFDNPEQYGYTLRAKTLEEHRQRLVQPSWKHIITLVVMGRSPTRPMSAASKIGASPSLLIATMVRASLMPVMCWMAPEMPIAM